MNECSEHGFLLLTDIITLFLPFLKSTYQVEFFSFIKNKFINLYKYLYF